MLQRRGIRRDSRSSSLALIKTNVCALRLMELLFTEPLNNPPWLMSLRQDRYLMRYQSHLNVLIFGRSLGPFISTHLTLTARWRAQCRINIKLPLKNDLCLTSVQMCRLTHGLLPFWANRLHIFSNCLLKSVGRKIGFNHYIYHVINLKCPTLLHLLLSVISLFHLRIFTSKPDWRRRPVDWLKNWHRLRAVSRCPRADPTRSLPAPMLFQRHATIFLSGRFLKDLKQ